MSAGATVTARKFYRCDGYRCPAGIRPGDDYARFTYFASDDGHRGSTTYPPRRAPEVMRFCQRCATEYDREMPPRRVKAGAP